jgi:hypothetical protein
MLLRGDEVASQLGLDPPSGHVLLAIRAASMLGNERDTARDSYLRQLEMIRTHLPGTPIWVASDAAGTEQIRPWDDDVSFAQDFGANFSANMLLGLTARCFIQIRGGGLSIGPMFSPVPWLIADLERSNENTKWMRAARPDAPWRPGWGSELSAWYPPGGDPDRELEAFLRGVAY